MFLLDIITLMVSSLNQLLICLIFVIFMLCYIFREFCLFNNLSFYRCCWWHFFYFLKLKYVGFYCLSSYNSDVQYPNLQVFFIFSWGVCLLTNLWFYQWGGYFDVSGWFQTWLVHFCCICVFLKSIMQFFLSIFICSVWQCQIFC